MSNYVSLPEELAQKISAMIIVDKKYQPNDQLPSEAELAKEMNVSRTSIREAVKILISSNLLYIKRGVGTFVCNNEIVDNNPYRILYSSSSKQLILESLEVRLALEVKSAQLAAERGTDEEIAEIIAAEQKCVERIRENANYSQEDKMFHLAVAKAAHNSIITQITPMISVSINTTLRDIKPDHQDLAQLNDSVLHWHKLIADFIQDRNPEGAGMAMYSHLHGSVKWIRKR